MARTTEVIRRIWDDEEGVALEIRPDQDGLGFIELYPLDDKSRAYFGPMSFTMDKDMAQCVGMALLAAVGEID